MTMLANPDTVGILNDAIKVKDLKFNKSQIRNVFKF